MTTTVTGLLCWRDSHPLEWQLASLHGHFETKSDAFSMRVYRSGRPAGADVLVGTQRRRVRLVHLFTPPHRRSVRAITLSTSPISKLRAANDGMPSATALPTSSQLRRR
jgi:hypothetical protein